MNYIEKAVNALHVVYVTPAKIIRYINTEGIIKNPSFKTEKK
jgi:hypothetical protein